MTALVIRPESIRCSCGTWFPARQEGAGRQRAYCDACRKTEKRRQTQKNLERARLDGKLQAMQELAQLEDQVRALVENSWEGAAVLNLIREARRRVAS